MKNSMLFGMLRRICLKVFLYFPQLFFGKHSDNLPDFLNIYYDLFPEERNKFSSDIEAMYFGKNYTERCRKILIPLIDDPRTRVTEKTLDIITDITVSLTKDLLEKKCNHPELCSEDLQKRMSEILHFVIDKF